jgi:hypothetical protein
VARPVSQGGWGAVELEFRYSITDLNDGLLEGGEMDIYSLGVNWWFTRSTSLSVNYRHISLDRSAIQGDSSGPNARMELPEPTLKPCFDKAFCVLGAVCAPISALRGVSVMGSGTEVIRYS